MYPKSQAMIAVMIGTVMTDIEVAVTAEWIKVIGNPLSKRKSIQILIFQSYKVLIR